MTKREISDAVLTLGQMKEKKNVSTIFYLIRKQKLNSLQEVDGKGGKR